VAAPSAQVNNTLLSGNPPTLFGFNKILPVASGQRTDALFLIEYRGPASTQLNQPAMATPTPANIIKFDRTTSERFNHDRQLTVASSNR